MGGAIAVSTAAAGGVAGNYKWKGGDHLLDLL